MTNEDKQELARQLKNSIEDLVSYLKTIPAPADLTDIMWLIKVESLALYALTAQPVQLPYSWQVGDSSDGYFNDEVFTASDVRDALKEAGVSYVG